MFNIFGKTDIGKVRDVNEDCFGIVDMGAARLIAVCDGIGGSAGGKQASAMALSAFTEFLRAQWADLPAEGWEALSLAQIKRVMRAAATDASRRVHAAAQCDPSLAGMGSTLVAALLTDRRAYVLHVGDSRLYAVTAGGVERMTRDHSYLQYLIDVGRITPDQAKELDIRNYITQAIGAYDHVDGDFCALDLAKYEAPTYLLLCSDGLYSMVSEERMRSVLLGEGLLCEKVDRLIALANQSGGTDNITAVIAEL